MAQCKDCIHGEVCGVFVHTRTMICNDKADKMCKLFKPTADVVPKSEVADLQDSLKCEKETNKHLNDEYIALMKENEKLTINMNAYGLTAKRLKEDVDRLQEINNNQVENIRLAKQEVAREIFEDIANIMVLKHGFNENHIVAHIDFELLKELKKKYTKENEKT